MRYQHASATKPPPLHTFPVSRGMATASDSGRLGIALAVVATLATAVAVSLFASESRSWPVDAICIAQIALAVLHLIATKNRSGLWCDFQLLVYIAVFLFNGGGIAISRILLFSREPLLQAFQDPIFLPFGEIDIIKAQVFCCCCLGGMTCGLLIVERSKAAPQCRQHRLLAEAIFRIGIFLCLASSPFAAYGAVGALRRIQVGGYQALYDSSLSGESVLTQLQSGLIPGLLYVFSAKSGNRLLVKCVWAILLTLSLLWLLTGERGRAFQALTALIYLHHFSYRNLSRAAVVFTCIAGMLVSTTVFTARNINKGEAITVAALVESLGAAWSGVDYFFRETGASLITVVYTQILVPEIRPHAFGWTAIRSVASTVPGALSEDDSEFEAVWLTREVAPSVLANNGGIGFSILAEAYLNFGWCAPLCCVAIWWIASKFSVYVHSSRGTVWLGFAAALISILLMGARGSTLTFTRRSLLLVAVPAIAAIFSKYERHAAIVPAVNKVIHSHFSHCKNGS